MNHGAHDDPLDYGEVPGHGPTVILSHLDGDETVLPRAVEHRLRNAREALHEEIRESARRAYLRGSGSTPPCGPDEDDEDESVDTSPPVMAPIYASFGVAVCVQVLVTVLLVALRVGGALDWSWGWALAPMWVPSTVATVLVAVICLWLAAMDEREAARRRNLPY